MGDVSSRATLSSIRRPFARLEWTGIRARGKVWSKSPVTGHSRPLITSITARQVETRLIAALVEAEAAAKKHGSVFGQLGDGEPLGSAQPADRASELHRKFRKFLKRRSSTTSRSRSI
jgi:hypothetical protein